VTGLGRGPAAAAATLALALSLAGCATLSEVAALRRVDFAYDRVSDVRLAGIAVNEGRLYSDLGAADVGRLAAALAAHDVPLDFVVHVQARNPADNAVTARLVGLDWTFFLEDDELVSGKLDDTYAFPPGEAVDVPVRVSFDAYDAVSGNARSLFETALAIAGVEGYTKEIRLDATPTVETPYGPMRYPGRITLRREVGGS
jgi:hypothetical protein